MSEYDINISNKESNLLSIDVLLCCQQYFVVNDLVVHDNESMFAPDRISNRRRCSNKTV